MIHNADEHRDLQFPVQHSEYKRPVDDDMFYFFRKAAPVQYDRSCRGRSRAVPIHFDLRLMDHGISDNSFRSQ